jgi:hypothetical protein
MIKLKTFGTVLFVGVSLVAYGCSSGDKAASSPVDAGVTADTGTPPATEDGGACKATQVPSDYERCFTFESKALPTAQPVTTTCLPSALASERATGRMFADFAFGNFVLSEAYDLSSDCATPKTLTESVRYFDIYIDVVAEYTARADGAAGKTAVQYPRLPPPAVEEAPDAGDAADAGDAGDAGKPPTIDAGAPPLAQLAFPERGCPPAWPQVKCIDVKPWFEGGYFTATETELRLFKDPPGSSGPSDGTSAQLYAVYKKVQ